jgi:GTP-binding protein LepA
VRQIPPYHPRVSRGPQQLLRNFSIIAHIDHGKSTLADRILEIGGITRKGEHEDQMLDDMDLERERGITIKARAVCLKYRKGGVDYTLNLIDTPGHVDFTYEVSRSLAACEGAILLVDATQGVEAQTVANAYLAVEAGLDIVPVLNKVDIATANTARALDEMHSVLGIDPATVLWASGKSGQGVREVIDAVIDRVRAPEGDPDAPLRALLFDAVYDTYRGVIIYVRLIDGEIHSKMTIRLLGAGAEYEVLEVGVLRPSHEAGTKLRAGESGYVVANIKTLKDVRIGDTVVEASHADDVPALPGYREPKPMVYCGLYPTYPKDYEGLRKALDTLALNDASFTYLPETSEALGFGFRCGFLGLLHMEIVQERLERDGDLDLVQTAPNVTYEILKTDGALVRVEKPSDIPESNFIAEFREPFARCNMILPAEYIGTMMAICQDKRGRFVRTEYLSPERVMLVYDVPLGEIVFDFYDMLKSSTRGYGTLDYEVTGYEQGDLVRLRMLVNGIEVDALSMVCHRDEAERRGRKILRRLRKAIPRHLFSVPLQVAIGGKIVARETIAPLRKDVLAKCYGGDITRKRKLLEKQKRGKKRMKQVGSVEIPQEAFLSVLANDDDEEDNE